MKKLFSLFFIIGMATQLYAQPGGSANHLLWRITGNGLNRPSYLFGTMHLTDKRLFQFGDSVYKALEKTEGFAAELDLNSIFTQYINSMVAEEKEKVYIEKSIDKEWLQKNRALLEKRFKKPVSQITVDDLNAEEQKQNAKLLESGEMKTFMDAYLFDIASRQGKWTGGIEDPEDQLGVKEEVPPSDRLRFLLEDKTDSKNTIEWMINTYLKEDLELIDRTDMIWRGARDAILLKRNIKMALRIDSLSHVRSCLFAVGAAHLPGDTGVVNLLRQKGYTVVPVVSSRRIAPEAYTFIEKERPWVNVMMRDSLYSLQMPVKPLPFKGIETSAIDMQFHFDLGSYSGYFTLGVTANVPSEDIRDTILNRIVQSYRGKGMSITSRNILSGQVKGKELILKNAYGEYRIQAFVPGDYVALNAVFAMKKNVLFDKDAERFFASFRPRKITDLRITKGPVKWQKFDFTNDGFSIALPAKYSIRREPDSEEGGWKRKSYEVIDIYSQAYYGVTVDETTAGYYSDGDSTFFETARENLAELMKASITDSMHTRFRGFPAYRLALKSEEDKSRIITRMFMVNRGNRRYGLFLAYDSAIGILTSGEQFFRSFALLPIPKPVWQTTTSPDKSFSTWAPSSFFEKEDESLARNVTRYMMHDTVAAVTAIIDKEIFPPYYWVKSEKDLYDQRIKTFVGEKDSVIRRHDIKIGNANGVDIDIWLAESQNIKKMRLLLNGDTLYTIFAFVPDEIVKQGEYDRFFGDFNLTHTVVPENLFTPKAAELINVLQTGDDDEFELAKTMLDKLPLTSGDLPLLQNALLFIYRDSSESEYGPVVSKDLVELVARFDEEKKSLAFIKQNYSQLGNEKEAVKPWLLLLLVKQGDEEAYDLLKELLLKDPPANNSYHSFYSEMQGSAHVARMFPGLLSALSDPNIGIHIADIAVELIEKGELSKRDLVENKRAILSAAKVHLASKDVEDEVPLSVNSLLRLLAKLNDPMANEWLQKVLARSADDETKLVALGGLVTNKQAVAKSELLQLAKSDATRNKLYELLKSAENLKLFPVEYLSQRWMGQSQLYEWVASDDDPPAKIDYIGEKVAMYLGEKKKFHLYKIMQAEGEPESYHLGVAGPYALDAKNLETTATATQPYIDEIFSTTKLNEQFKKFLKDREEENK